MSSSTPESSAYNGRVSVAGPPQVRQLAGATVTKIAVGPYDNNSYLLQCDATGAGLLIDAAAEPERLLELVADVPISRSRRPMGTLIIGRHSPTSWPELEHPRWLGASMPRDIPVPTDRLLEGGETVEIGALTVRTIHLQGHTPGSIVFVFDDAEGSTHVFTGDCLFPGGVGKTWDDSERFDSLYTGVVRELFERPRRLCMDLSRAWCTTPRSVLSDLTSMSGANAAGDAP